MTISEIRDLFAYNAWANRRIFENVAQVRHDQYMADMKTSHGGIHGTLTHMIGAEKIWLDRWRKEPKPMPLKAADIPSFDELKRIWETVNEERNRFLAKFKDDSPDEPMTETTRTMKYTETPGGAITVTTLKGDSYTNTFSQMMQHLVNHSTYHRGQIVAMLRQIGVTPSATDLIAYYRKK